MSQFKFTQHFGILHDQRQPPASLQWFIFFFVCVQYIKTTLSISLFSVLSQKVGGRGEGKKCVIVRYILK